MKRLATALAFVNTLLATCAATVSWTLTEWKKKGKPSMLGAASGAIAPACGFVGPMGGLVIGRAAGAACYGANAVGSDDMFTQLTSQLWGVGVSVVWSGTVSFLAFKRVDMTIGLRVSKDHEREGLDLAQHGEKAWHLLTLFPASFYLLHLLLRPASST